MKIKKLAITNLASIAAAELDFTCGALGEDPLFLICGDTGAGKTTILDAICLALYGLTPRYTASKRVGVDIGGFKSDDVRQLVRHGATTASAVLTLEGNDGRNYEASWIVDARVKGQNKGTLKEAEWVWKDVTGNQTYAQKSECEEVVQRAVGLDFGQFCRTTLLAQGQFTKFLLGADEEKAKILEKLTDTSRYSDLGKKIKSAFKSAEDEVKDLKRKIEALAGMSDEERAAAEQERAELDAAAKAAAAAAVAAKVQADWLKRLAQLEMSARNATDALTAAYASLKASARQKREVLDETEKAYAAVCAALEKEAARKGLYEAADVVVSNLRDVRQAEKEKAQAENERDELAAVQPALETRARQAEGAQEEAERAASGKRKQIDDAVVELEKMELGRLRQEKEGLVKKSGDLAHVLSQMAENDRRQGTLETLRLELKSRKDEHDARQAELPKLAADRDEAKARWEQACAERKVQKNLIDDGIKRIVAGLKTGDTCPICGNRIDELHGEAYFTELIARLNKACDTAEKAFRERESASNQAVARVDALAKSLAGEARRIDQEEMALRAADAALQEKARGYGVAELTSDAIASARAACDARMDELSGLIRDGEAKEGAIKVLRAEGQKLNDAFLRAKDALARARQALQDCVQKQDAKQEAIVAADARAREKFAAAAEKFVRAGWEAAWRADAEGFERQLQKSAKAYRAQQDQKQDLEHAVETLRQACGQMAACLARAEAQEPALADVAADARAAGNGTAEVDARLGQLAAVKGERAEHESNRPAALAATDTEESLRRAAAERQAACDDLQKRKGALEQRLADDATRGTERARLQRALVTAQETLDEWKPLYEHFGDEDGKKVRLAIQAYVLKNVLVKANAVLARLADRYELSCEGLTLTVRDAYEGGAERPVNTLSGGEGFLVSLALALGLAGVNERGLGVDMLFIDEGFGTLSGEHLDRAVESLEGLNALCGCRKVGVISHVERLREKIRTHVEVTREGYDPSVVRVSAAPRGITDER